MNRRSILIALSCALFAQVGIAQQERELPTPLQLKSIQTRKFLKNPNEVLRAAKTYCEDIGALNAIIRPALKRGDTGIGVPGTGTLTCIFTPKIERTYLGGIKVTGMQQIKFEALSFTSDFIDLRARIYSGYPNQAQLVGSDEYSALFKAIGDSIFTEAIQVEAAIQE